MGRESLRHKRCLLTGATGGLGRAIATELASAGATVYLSARDRVALEAMTATTAAFAGLACANLELESDVLELAASARRVMGGVDVLVNNAGVFPVKPLAETTTAELDACWGVNVRAPYLLCRELAPLMAEAGWGRIVNVASSSAYAGFRDTTAYCASKHALLGLSRALNDELKTRGVRTYCISPGSIRTPMGLRLADQDPATFLDPAEVAAFLVDVVSQDGTMMTDEVRLNRLSIQ